MTGIGTINPLGNNIQEYFANLKAGVSGAAPITHFDAEKFKTRFACEVKGYNWEDFFDRKEVRKYDLFSQYAMIASDQAMTDSGIDLEKVDKLRSGVIWASGIGGLRSMFDEIAGFLEGGQIPRFSPFFIPKMISDIATDQIRMGRADIMITGGSESAVNQPGVGGFNSMQALSTRNDDPATASRPYDADRDGFVIGEGAGGLILEEYEHAKARGAKIYAEVGGSGMSADAYHFTAPHPEGLGAKHAMEDAMKEAGISPDQVDYINTHGTSTPAGDIPELIGIQGAIGDRIYEANLSSTKSMTGHLLGAAGAIEALACIMAITEGVIPPTINNFTRDPNIDARINLTLNTAQERDVRVAMSNTFGFGGHNATVLLKRI